MAKSIDAHFAAILKDVRANVERAVKIAAKKAQSDIIKEANTYLEQYYANYTPKKYKRTHYLKNAILPISKIDSNNRMIKITIGVRYSPSKLAGHYTSNSKYHQSGAKWVSHLDKEFKFDSSNNGIPEPDWILNNFLHGQHGGYQQDFNSTYTLMDDFLANTLPDRIQKYVQRSVWHIFTSNL